MRQAQSAALLLILCIASTAHAALIPIPDEPTQLTAAAPAAIAPQPAATATAYPAVGATAGLAQPAAAYPAAAAAATPSAYPAAYPAAATPAAYPAAATPAAFPAAAAPAAFPAAATPAAFPGAVPAANPYAYGLPSVGAMPGLPAAFPAGYPGAAGGLPGADPVISVPTMGAAMPGAIPTLPDASMAGALAGPALPAGLLPADINTRISAPPPRARPAAPPAPPIPTGASFKPQWDDLKDFTESDVIVSFNVANTPEQIYWNQKKVREALAKAGGMLPNSVNYYQVLPSTDDYGRPYTTVRFVVQNKNPELASNLLTSLNDEKTQNNLKNRIEELNLDMIGDTMKVQTPTDYKASARAGDGPLPSATMMDTTGGLNGIAAAGAASSAGGPGLATATPDVPPLPGTAAAAAAGGNASSTAGLPGLPTGGTTSTLAARRAAASAATSPAAAGAAMLVPLLLGAGALLL